MNQMIFTMKSTMEIFTQAKMSHKKQRDEMSESESSNREDFAEVAGNPPDISSKVHHLQTAESSKKCSKADEDEALGELSKLCESEGMVSDPVNAKLSSLVDKMVKTSLSEEKTKEKQEKYNKLLHGQYRFQGCLLLCVNRHKSQKISPI